jgi:hypothetical protein
MPQFLISQLETTNSFEGIIIPHPPLCCLTFKQCKGGCGIKRTNVIWIKCSVTHPPFIWGNCNLRFPLILNRPMLNFPMKIKSPSCNLQFPPLLNWSTIGRPTHKLQSLSVTKQRTDTSNLLFKTFAIPLKWPFLQGLSWLQSTFI